MMTTNDGLPYVFKCSFGGQSNGKNTSRIGVKLPVDSLDAQEARELFAGSQIECALTKRRSDELDGQRHLFDDSSEVFTAIAETKKFSIDTEWISFSLGFPCAAIKKNELWTLFQLRNSAGTIRMKFLGKIETPESDDDDDETDDLDEDSHPDIPAGKDRPVGGGTPALKMVASETDPGWKTTLSGLGKERLETLAEKHGKPYKGEGLSEKVIGIIKSGLQITCIRQLEDKINKARRENFNWANSLSGVGPAMQTKVDDALLLFRLCVGYPDDIKTATEEMKEAEAAKPQAEKQAFPSGIDPEKLGPANPKDSPEEAYARGYGDHEKGVARSDNPYPEMCMGRVNWGKGWDDSAKFGDGVEKKPESTPEAAPKTAFETHGKESETANNQQ